MSNGKTYQYKHYNSTGTIFYGVLSNVVSEFSLNREINSAGSAIRLELATSFQDATPTLEYDNVGDELGNTLADEDGNDVVSDVFYDLGTIPNLNDRILVYEFSDEHPDGVLMFTGLVSKFDASYQSNTVTIDVLSYGVQLDNYIVQLLPGAESTGNSLYDTDGQFNADTTYGYAQEFTVASDITNPSFSINMRVQGSAQVAFYLIEGTTSSPGAYISFVLRSLTEQDMGEVLLTTSGVTLAAGTNYFFRIANTYLKKGISSFEDFIALDSTGSYAGDTYTFNTSFTYSLSTSSLTFSIIAPTGAIGGQFNTYDPSDIMRELLDSANAQGAIPAYTTSSIVDTNSTVSYTFKYSTYLEAMKKVVELAPADWYWFVSCANGTVHFNVKGDTAQHTLVLGSHIHDLDISQSLETVKNNVYFSGGDTGSGTNLTANGNNSTSLARYGSWLELPSDNRVTTSATADIIINSILNQFSTPKFAIKVSVPSSTYDITTFELGQNVSFRNFNSLVDSLVLQIHGINYTPQRAELTLEILPPTQSKRVEDIKRNLRLQETRDNPNDT